MNRYSYLNFVLLCSISVEMSDSDSTGNDSSNEAALISIIGGAVGGAINIIIFLVLIMTLLIIAKRRTRQKPSPKVDTTCTLSKFNLEFIINHSIYTIIGGTPAAR